MIYYVQLQISGEWLTAARYRRKGWALRLVRRLAQDLDSGTGLPCGIRVVGAR